MRRPPPSPTAALLALLSAGCLSSTLGEGVTPQRPTVSSDANTTAPGTLEVESGVSLDPHDAFDVPVTLKYGLAEGTEVFAGFSPLRGVEDPDDEIGIGDVLLGGRARIREADASGPAAAVQLAVKLPTADEDDGLGSGELDLFAAGMLTGTADETGWNAYYQLGLLGEPGGSAIDLDHVLAVVASREIAHRWAGFAELAVDLVPEHDVSAWLLTVGATQLVREDLAWDVGLGIGLSDDAPDLVVFVGDTRNFGALP